MIYVCGLFDMPMHVETLRPGYLVSLIQPEFQPPTPAGMTADRHHRVAVHDISERVAGATAPERAHIEDLIEFLDGRHRDEGLLVHCYAGISRSTAAALIALALDAEGREREAGLALRRAAPHARPNARIVALGDEILGRHGRLLDGLRAMGAGVPAFEERLTSIAPLEPA